MRTSARTGLTATLAFAAAAGVVRADVGPTWSDDQLTAFSSAVVTGRVADLAIGRDITTGAIHTYVTVGVDSVLKGDIAEREIVVKQLGGRLGDETHFVFGQAEFVVGEEVLLFLEVRPRDRTLYTAALWQGKWSVERGPTGEQAATRRGPEVERRGILQGDAERRTLSSFAARVSALSGGGRREGAEARRFVAEPPAEEMRALVHQSRDALPFTQLGPYRWTGFDTRTTIPVDVQSTGQPGLAGGGTNELISAASVWINATGLSLAGAGSTSRCLFAGPFDGHISITFNDPCGDIDNSGGTIAVGGAAYSASGGGTFNGVRFGRVVAGYYVTGSSSSARPFLQNSGCFTAVATHEIGHVLGMGHSADPSAIMYPSIAFSSCAGGSRGANADDIAGIRFIYPPSTSTPTAAPGAPRNLTTSSSGSTVTLSWLTPASGGSPTSYIVEAGSSSGASNLANFSTGSTATTFSAGGVGAGSYYIRVKAMNSAGTSAASNESLLVVGSGGGPCTGAPGAPSGLTITGNSSGTVSFAWNASPGSPTTYIIEAGSTPGATNLANSDLGGTATTFTATGVGRGTYYVRLRAKNTCGTSGVSNEVTLVVP